MAEGPRRSPRLSEKAQAQQEQQPDTSKFTGLPVSRFFGDPFHAGKLPAGEWATGVTGKVVIKACWQPNADAERGLCFEFAPKGTGLGSEAPQMQKREM